MMPYWGEYLRQVLRPKVEKVLEEHADNWNEMVWELMAKTIADQQPGGAPASIEQISTLLRDELGLQLQVSVSAEFVESDGSTTPVEPDVVGSVSESGAERVEVRRRTSVSPLAAAVSSPKRKG